VLGIWVATAEGAKAWAQALAQLRNRGLEEVLLCCCGGLNGLGGEIAGTWPDTTVQTCTVHYPDTAVMPIRRRLPLVTGVTGLAVSA